MNTPKCSTTVFASICIVAALCRLYSIQSTNVYHAETFDPALRHSIAPADAGYVMPAPTDAFDQLSYGNQSLPAHLRVSFYASTIDPLTSIRLGNTSSTGSHPGSIPSTIPLTEPYTLDPQLQFERDLDEVTKLMGNLVV